MTTDHSETVRRREAYDAAADRANAAWIAHVLALCNGEASTDAFERYQVAQAERRATWMAYCEIMGVTDMEVAV